MLRQTSIITLILIFILLSLLLFSIIMNNFKVLNRDIDRINSIDRQIKNVESIVDIDNKIRNNKLYIENVINKFNTNFTKNELDSISSTINEMSIKYSNLDIPFICAVITHESALTWDPLVRSHVGAVGLMQIMPYTAKNLLNTKQNIIKLLEDPIFNIKLGCKYLSYLIELYGIEGGLAGYNGGPYRANKFVSNNYDYEVLAEETKYYIPYVLGWYDKLRKI